MFTVRRLSLLEMQDTQTTSSVWFLKMFGSGVCVGKVTLRSGGSAAVWNSLTIPFFGSTLTRVICGKTTPVGKQLCVY